MEEQKRQSTSDDYLPKTRLQFADGATLIAGMKWDDDDPLYHGVNLIFDSGRNAEPEVNILLPPHSIDILIRVLQERANEARYIMGQNMVEYPRLPEKKIRKKKK
jgi:hypothetical protein